MTDTTAKIRAKGLDSTGVTEDIARQMRDNLGGYYLAIVELKVDAVSEDAEGNHKVDLTLRQVEPSTSPDLDNHLRELTRTLHYNRKLHSPDEQLQIETLDDVEPKVEQVLAAGQQFIAEHDDELPNPDDGDEPSADPCPTPGCELLEEHHGDHAIDPTPDEQWQVTEPDGVNDTGDEPEDNVRDISNPFATSR